MGLFKRSIRDISSVVPVFVLCKCFKPTSPLGAGGAASSALLLGLADFPASPAASRLASEAAALGANVTVIMNTSTEVKLRNGMKRMHEIIRRQGMEDRSFGQHTCDGNAC